ncbi:MAG: hypothetical protein IKJ80_01495 [Clostridia bacterium]|nr:hypothetical protein [Clostridia bacterium]
MEFKKSFWSQWLACICLFIFIPIAIPVALFILIFKFITIPFSYYKYTHSQYQKDFPHKFNFLAPFHIDNIPYSIIKENELPIQYFKRGEEYGMHGYFIYKDILLDFTEPFFFDPKTSTFTFYPAEEDEEKMEDDSNQDIDDIETCLSVEETKAFVLNDFHNNIQERQCKQVVFFYSQKKLEKAHGKIALNRMNELNDFIVYKKDTLLQALKEFTDTH